jgi:vitamin B12 transporter
MFALHKKTCRFVTAAITLFIFTMSAFAQTPKDSLQNEAVITLPSITVSTMRLDIEQNKLPQKIQIIDSLDLSLTPASDITDVLKKTASIDVIQYPGLLAGIGIRGFTPAYSGINKTTLTLFDGRPAGAPNLAEMQTSNIERIEVVKGPVSALYGPQAMGGVVNIIPRRSTGKLNTQIKTDLGSFETIDAIIHSGGSLFPFLNFDLSGSVFNQGKDFRIGSNNILHDNAPGTFDGKAKDIMANGDTVAINDLGAGLVRHYTTYDKHDVSLRLGTFLLNDKISIDVRGELFGADNVETPGDIATGDNGAGLKNVYRNDEEVRISGDFDQNKLSLLQYYTKESSKNFKGFKDGDTMWGYYAGGTKWQGFQAKDDYHFHAEDFLIKPVFTLGLDYNKVEAWSQSWSDSKTEVAPYSPNSQQTDLGLYMQIFSDMKDGLATLTAGLRYDKIKVKIPSSSWFPNNREREEAFDVISPSYGLTFSPFKIVGNDFPFTLYHNLGKGFIPQSAANLAAYYIGKPDAKGKVQITLGNPDLKPQENITVDGGIRTGIEAVGISADLGLYRTVVDNFVSTSYDSVPAGMTQTYNGITYPVAAIQTYKNNDGKTTMAGFEWDFEWNVLRLFHRSEKLAISTNGHAVLLSENVSNGITTEVKLVRNPNFSVALTYDDNKLLTARLSTRYSGKQKDTDYAATVYPYPDIIYPSFLVTDISMRVKVNEHHAVNAQVANMTDENYYEKRGYNLPGRSFGLGYEYSF